MTCRLRWYGQNRNQIAQMFNLSIPTSQVPSQWKQAYIRPVPKVAHPVLNTDFRPISITPVLTRTMERLIVTQFLYPAITYSDISKFSDQYTFRRTGSPTAAIISLLHTVTHLLTDNPYVIVISLDFSKTFDTVRHSALFDKMAQLDMPDEVYNCWSTVSMVIRSVRITEEMFPLCLKSLPASYMALALDLRLMLSIQATFKQSHRKI